MSEPNDPFADRPYVPPTDQPGGSGAPGRGPADHEPTVQQPRYEQPQGTQQQPAYGQQAPQGSPYGAPQQPQPQHYGGHGGHGGGTPPPAWAAPTPVAPGPKQPKQRGAGFVALVTVLALIVGGVAGLGGAALYGALTKDDDPISSLQDDTGSDEAAPTGQVEKVAKAVLPSTTQINVTGGGQAGSGTGIIMSSDGEILTNNHVVEAAANGGSITVSFSDGTNAKAEIVGRDPKTDLAVIKAEGKTGLKPAKFGKSSDLKVGQEVVAIGSPFGLESTVTQGIVSALNRPVASSDGSGANATVFPAVQTDAAINPGNSGGPLVDLAGRVIGINSAIRSGGSSGGSAGSIGLGFAIPVDLAKNVAERLVKGEKVEHAQIGITVSPAVSSDDITGVGAEVERVASGSAGDKAGIKKGDVITSVNGDPIGSSNALVASIRAYQPGEKVTLTVRSGDETKKVEVTLDSDGGETTD